MPSIGHRGELFSRINGAFPKVNGNRPAWPRPHRPRARLTLPQARLKSGNERFVTGRTVSRDLAAQRHATAAGQYPFAVVLSCLDSRTSTELVFDQGIGDVEGDGSRGKRPADIPEFANIQIEVIVPPSVADRLLETLWRDLFPRYAMVAFESDVRVLRPQKF